MLKKLILVILAYILVCMVIIKWQPASNNSRYVIHSEKLMNIISRLSGFPPDLAKAASPIPPFVILRRKDHPMNDTRIHHEQTHHLQQLESLRLRNLISRGEGIYYEKHGFKTHYEAYLLTMNEQEAYLNQDNPGYNQTRLPRATRYYRNHKTEFHLDNYQVVIEK